jgi:hypothetical protein
LRDWTNIILAEPDHDARRFASTDCGLLGLRCFRCGNLGAIDALTAMSRNAARPNVRCGVIVGPGGSEIRLSLIPKGGQTTFTRYAAPKSWTCLAAHAVRKHEISRRLDGFGPSDLPDDLIFRIRVKPIREKYSPSVFRKYMLLSRRPASARGAYASSRTWKRDAMDAATSV